MTARLRGHTAIVGLDPEGSESLARRLVKEGAQVVLVSPDGRRGGELASAIQEEGRPAPAVFCMETGAEGEVDALVELVAELSHRSAPRLGEDGP